MAQQQSATRSDLSQQAPQTMVNNGGYASLEQRLKYISEC
jgi:hypothetical protein